MALISHAGDSNHAVCPLGVTPPHPAAWHWACCGGGWGPSLHVPHLGVLGACPWHLSVFLSLCVSLFWVLGEEGARSDNLFHSQASGWDDSSLGGARRGSVCGSQAVRPCLCPWTFLPSAAWPGLARSAPSPLQESTGLSEGSGGDDVTHDARGC